MNFLAHLLLSGNDPRLMLGNFIGDSVKGHDYLRFPKDVQRGILMHREIDNFTDHHPLVHNGLQRLQPFYHKYSGVVLDIFYDHFLAVNFDRYSSVPLPDFARFCYDSLRPGLSLMPEKAAFMFPYMEKGNWLFNYSSLEGISRTLGGMARRARFESGMEKAVIHLQQYYNEFGKEFEEFFPILKEHVAPYLIAEAE